MLLQFRRRDRRRLQASFRRGTSLPLLETEIQAIQLSPYHADLPGAPPRTPGHGRRFPGMLLSPSPFGSWVSHQIQRYLLSSLPAARAI